MSGIDERERVRRSLDIIEEYQWMLVHHVAVACAGDDGDPWPLLERVAKRAGTLRAGWLTGDGLEGQGWSAADAATAARGWPGAEVAHADLLGRATTDRVTPLPGQAELVARGHDAGDAARWWRALWAGVAGAKGVPPWVRDVRVDDDGITVPGLVPGAPWPDEIEVMDGVVAGRRSFAALAVLAAAGAYVLEAHRGWNGLNAARQALYAFGRERGEGQRRDIEAAGGTPDLESWWNGLNERDPHLLIYRWKPGGTVEPDVLHDDCTYCPMASAWRAAGPAGLRYGEMYDVEVHQGLVDAAAPGARVVWTKLKTRGDDVCEFRFRRDAPG